MVLWYEKKIEPDLRLRMPVCAYACVWFFFLLYGSPCTPQAPTVAMQLLTQELGNNRPVIWCKKSALQVNNNLRTSRFEVV